MEDDFSLLKGRSTPPTCTGGRVRGMEDVIATVSGYHGLERFKLIKLINYTGANYVGAMSRSTTHLVCWRLEGRKYELARDFGTMVVSHRWFEDCLKAGKRLPERHYRMKSGQQAGPLSWEVPVGENEEDKDSLCRKDGIVLSDLTNTCKETSTIDMNAECIWSKSSLLSESQSPDLGTQTNSFKSGVSSLHRNSKRSRNLIDKHLKGVLSSNGLIDMEHGESSSRSSSAIDKKSVCSPVENTVTGGPTRKSRRLVKKCTSRGILKSSMLDSEQGNRNIARHENAATLLDTEEDCCPTGAYNFTTEDIDLDSFGNENIPVPQGRNLMDSFCNGENRNEVVDVEGFREINNVNDANDSNTINEGMIHAQEMLSQRGLPDYEDNFGSTQEADDNIKRVKAMPASMELSCVICWTDFSSTRGVLACGHRFCYSCIQNWADTMASRRKVSTCPLCKASFVSITKVDGAASSDQKIYSQTIPYDSSVTDIFVLQDWENSSYRAQASAASVCCQCRSREPEDLLIACHLCSSRSIHTYCLDPPVIHWTCNNCRDLRMLYLRHH